MYMIDSFVDTALGGRQLWTSKDHRTVAVNICISNPAVHTMEDLKSNCETINRMSLESVHTATVKDLIALGCVM